MKEAYYFSHDANARQDVKIMALMDSYGWAGYGMYWAIIEALRSEPGYKLPNKPYTIAAFQRMFNDSSTDVQQFINDLLNKFELLSKDDEHIYSNSLIRRMQDVEKRREIAKNAGKASAMKRAKNQGILTDVEHPLNMGSTNVQPVKERKDINIIANWRNDFELFKSQLRQVYNELKIDKEWIEQMRHVNPGVNILLTLEKLCITFWATENGWEFKKKDKKKLTIDWKHTLTSAVCNKKNHVYEQNRK